ncbi:MAG: glycerophosphodiester phosphodiesterase [Gemmatimonadota bacterium]
MNRPLIIAHRGASGMALENSLEAFRRAIALDVDGLELDFHATLDGELVVHHDPALPGAGLIGGMRAAEVAGFPLEDGFPAPLLSQVLALGPACDYYLEAKGLPERADRHLLDLIAATGFADRVHVHAFDHRIIARLHRKAASLSLGVLSASVPVDPVAPVLAAGATTLWQAAELIDKELVDQCLAGGVDVIAWTVNESAEARRLGELGVAGLCGNWPDRLRLGR